MFESSTDISGEGREGVKEKFFPPRLPREGNYMPATEGM